MEWKLQNKIKRIKRTNKFSKQGYQRSAPADHSELPDFFFGAYSKNK